MNSFGLRGAVAEAEGLAEPEEFECAAILARGAAFP